MLLQRLGGDFAYEEVMPEMKMFGNRLVEAETAQTHGARTTLSVDREARKLIGEESYTGKDGFEGIADRKISESDIEDLRT